MSDVNDKNGDDDKEAEDKGPVGGERLGEARRAMQIPVIEIAKELHLDEYKVRALERNEFEVLGAPVFAKGHLRKYAQLVDVDEADVMADYYQLNRAESAPPVLSVRSLPKAEFSPGPWIAGIVALLLAAAAYWWFFERGPEAEAPAERVNSIAPQPSAAPVIETQPAASEEIEQPVVDTQATTDDVVENVVQDETVEPAPQPGIGEVALRVTYGGDCWTEITDGRGRRLFFDLGTAGRTVNVSGEAPLNILFGDAENVSIEVNGAPYSIPAADRRGKTARLTLAGT